MTRIPKLIADDRISIGLLAVAVVSLLAALAATATASPRNVPERLLDRVRGADPSWFRVVNPTLPNCSYVMALYITLSTGPNAVQWSGCNAGNVGALCVQCADVKNYSIKPTPGTPLAFPAGGGMPSCNGPAGGSSGNCAAVGGGNFRCIFTDGIQCNVSAIVYRLEP